MGPLGRPHDGPTVVENVLCLYPNHHVLFDKGAIFIEGEWVRTSADGSVVAKLRIDAEHALTWRLLGTTVDISLRSRRSTVDGLGIGLQGPHTAPLQRVRSADARGSYAEALESVSPATD
ncbi:HNH endonuclease [Blastococcus sp. SYSU DS0828]